MKKNIYTLVVIVVLVFVVAFLITKFPSNSVKNNTEPWGVIYGPNYSYSLAAPDGWVLDNKAGQDQGLAAVFYKKGEDYQTSDVIMYTNTISKSPTKPNFDAVINYDLQVFKKAYPNLEISDAPDLTTMDKSSTKAKVKYEFNEPMGRYQAVAYIDSPNTVVIVVLDAKNKSAFDNNVTSFKKLVNSYFYVTSNVQTQSTNP